MKAGPLGVCLDRLGTPDATALAEVLLPVPNKLSPHRNIDTKLRNRLSKRCRYLRGRSCYRLFSGPSQQSLVVGPIQVQESFIATAKPIRVNLRVASQPSRRTVRQVGLRRLSFCCWRNCSTAKDLQPSDGNFLITPKFDDIGAIAKDLMQMIA